MSKKITDNFGFIVLLLVISCYGCLWFLKCGGNNIASDGRYYYEYFIRIFIDHNLSGSGLIKYPVGTMLLELPFLAIASVICSVNGIDFQGGLNLHFQRAVFLAALFYLCFALILIYRFLVRSFSKDSVVIACGSLVFGTMIPVYMCEMSSFSHIYGLFVCTVFFVFVDYYENQYDHRKGSGKIILDFLIGFFLGSAALIRNTNVVIGASYLFFGINKLKDCKSRAKRVFSSKIIIQIFGFICVYAIQILLWYRMTGSWIIYSYSGESFLYKYNPQIMNVLFSDGKGLFIYCPILFVGLIAMIAFRKSNPRYWLAQWIVFGSITYLIAAWWCWWLGCAYGERMYCDVLVIFAIPLTTFFDGLICYYKSTFSNSCTRKILCRICFVATITFVVLNMVWIHATRIGLLSNNLGTWYDLQKSVFVIFMK